MQIVREVHPVIQPLRILIKCTVHDITARVIWKSYLQQNIQTLRTAQVTTRNDGKVRLIVRIYETDMEMEEKKVR